MPEVTVDQDGNVFFSKDKIGLLWQIFGVPFPPLETLCRNDFGCFPVLGRLLWL